MTTDPVESGDTRVGGTVEWVREDRACCGDTVEEIASPVVSKLARVYCDHFHSGGYLGGSFASERVLFKGAQSPPGIRRFVVDLSVPFVRGESYDTYTNIHAAMERMLKARV